MFDLVLVGSVQYTTPSQKSTFLFCFWFCIWPPPRWRGNDNNNLHFCCMVLHMSWNLAAHRLKHAAMQLKASAYLLQRSAASAIIKQNFSKISAKIKQKLSLYAVTQPLSRVQPFSLHAADLQPPLSKYAASMQQDSRLYKWGGQILWFLCEFVRWKRSSLNKFKQVWTSFVHKFYEFYVSLYGENEVV